MNIIFVEPACSERDIVVPASVQFMCVLALCLRLSRFVRAITCTSVHGFQNNLEKVFLLEEQKSHLKHLFR